MAALQCCMWLADGSRNAANPLRLPSSGDGVPIAEATEKWLVECLQNRPRFFQIGDRDIFSKGTKDGNIRAAAVYPLSGERCIIGGDLGVA